MDDPLGPGYRVMILQSTLIATGLMEALAGVLALSRDRDGLAERFDQIAAEAIRRTKNAENVGFSIDEEASALAKAIGELEKIFADVRREAGPRDVP